jgi:zinc transporter, ZIP family
MAEAFFWGFLGSAFLLVGAVVAYVFSPGRKPIAVIMALGSGLLIGSVAFELIDEALATKSVARVGLFVMIGACAFAVGDWLVSRSGGADRKDPTGAQASGTAMAIVIGSVMDGIPESFVLGLTVLQGGVSVALFVGVALSNLPEGMASSSGLKIAGWSPRRTALMWTTVSVVAGFSAAAGYALLDPHQGLTGALVQGFAAGALLAMVADTLLPEAYEVEGVLTGVLVAVGFSTSLLLSAV